MSRLTLLSFLLLIFSLKINAQSFEALSKEYDLIKKKCESISEEINELSTELSVVSLAYSNARPGDEKSELARRRNQILEQGRRLERDQGYCIIELTEIENNLNENVLGNAGFIGFPWTLTKYQVRNLNRERELIFQDDGTYCYGHVHFGYQGFLCFYFAENTKMDLGKIIIPSETADFNMAELEFDQVSDSLQYRFGIPDIDPEMISELESEIEIEKRSIWTSIDSYIDLKLIETTNQFEIIIEYTEIVQE